jgi:hypothetical protein
MGSQISRTQGTQQGITKGMNQNIRIGMASQTLGVGNYRSSDD